MRTTVSDTEMVMKLIHQQALDLVERARFYGVVITVETEPRLPLAMGNYRMVVHTRASRELYAKGKP